MSEQTRLWAVPILVTEVYAIEVSAPTAEEASRKVRRALKTGRVEELGTVMDRIDIHVMRQTPKEIKRGEPL